jgi:dTDP-glucose 4,6-dehydratase
MTSKLSNQAECLLSLRDDCLASCAEQNDIMAGLQKKRIAITGGTGFLGSWDDEMVATLNDV